jgi:molecular chaperone DnaK (HSP70)
MSRLAVGIDLGTSRASVAIYRNGKVEIIPNEYGGHITPSIVAFTRTDILVGEPAKAQQKSNLENTIYDNKRIIGKSPSEINFEQINNEYPFNLEAKDGQVVYKIKIPGTRKTKSTFKSANCPAFLVACL